MNKIRAVLFALMMLTVSLAGCIGGDDPVEDETPVETLDDWQVHFASTAADLPTCDSATEGRLYYVDADSEFQVCTSSGWDVIDVSGPAGQDGADGTSGTNGVDGADGNDGADGTDGNNGADGANGVSTLIRVLSSTTCTTGGNSFEIGADNNGDGILDVTEVIVTVDICNGVAGPAGQDGADGNDGADGTNGTDGQDGAPGNPGADGNDGNSTLMVMTNLSSSSSNCWGDGGVQIDVGIDDNKNGVLDSSEIDDTTYICNGGDGQDGTDGADGNDGADGTNGNDGADGADGNDGADGADGTNGSASPNTMLTSISSPAASLGCTAGGRVMMQGLDNGDGGGTAQNGVLESGEVDYTTTYCSKYVIWRVADINSGTGSSTPGQYMKILVGDTLYFDANDGSSGHELWAHDTSNASTWRVADIRSGASSSYPGSIMDAILVGDTLYFSANDGSSGYELWAHDTSNASTWRVTDINSGAGNSNPAYHMEKLVGDTLYFSAYDGNSGTELWAMDIDIEHSITYD